MCFRRSTVVLQASLLLVLAGCGESGPGPRVSDATQKVLPTQQYTLSEAVCPDILGMPPAEEERTRRRGERELEALLLAFRRNPDAVVRTSWSSSHDDEGIQHEDLTVGELLETHLSTAEELADDDDELSSCFERVATQLRAAQDAG